MNSNVNTIEINENPISCLNKKYVDKRVQILTNK